LSTFATIIETWRGSKTRQSHSELRVRILEGDWLSACRHAVRSGDSEEINRWLTPDSVRLEILDDVGAMYDNRVSVGNFYVRQLRAYLMCARAAISTDNFPSVDEALLLASREVEFPVAFYRDLTTYLSGGHPDARPTETVTIGIVLVELGHRGVVARLKLQKMPRGTAALYPAVKHGFLFRDAASVAAERTAREYARRHSALWRDNSDVRWSLDGIPTGLRRVSGGSLGGAFATGLHFLFTRPRDMPYYVVSAALSSSNGRFGPVQEAEVKLASISSAVGVNVQSVVVPPGFTPDSLAGLYNEQTGIHRLRPGREVHPQLYEVYDVAQAVSVLQQCQSRRRWQSLSRKAVPGVALSVFFFLTVWLLTPRFYSFYITGGGRILIRFGLTGFLLPSRQLDTGFIQRDFTADSVTRLLDKGWQFDGGNRSQWVDSVVNALPASVEKARFLNRLGRNVEAAKIWITIIKSPDSTPGAINSAANALCMSGYNRQDICEVLLPAFKEYLRTREGGAVDIGDALLSTNPVLLPQIVTGMRSLALQGGNNFVNIPAVELLVRADPRQGKTATSLLEYLALHDPNAAIRVKALQALFLMTPAGTPNAEIAARKVVLLCNPLLMDENGESNRDAFEALNSVGDRYPDMVVSSLRTYIKGRYARGRTGTVAFPVAVMAANRDTSRLVSRLITPQSAAGVMGVLLADDEPTLNRFALQIDDFFLENRANVEAYTHCLAVHLAFVTLRSGRKGDVAGNVEHLQELMQSDFAEHWAMYRDGCACAIAICVPRERHREVTLLLERKWRIENRPQIKVALSLAIEELSHDAP
jgi:hypothetical protein